MIPQGLGFDFWQVQDVFGVCMFSPDTFTISLYPFFFPFASYQMNLLLKEYILSGDGEEAERCLRDLEVPHFHHEFVYEVNISGWP